MTHDSKYFLQILWIRIILHKVAFNIDNIISPMFTEKEDVYCLLLTYRKFITPAKLLSIWCKECQRFYDRPELKRNFSRASMDLRTSTNLDQSIQMEFRTMDWFV